MRKSEIEALIIISPILILGWIAYSIFESLGTTGTIILCLTGIGIFFWYCYESVKKEEAARIARYNRLMEKYNDKDLVEKLMEGKFWQAQTSKQLLDSIGHPEAIDEKILKTKKKEVWKYQNNGGNRYNLRITLENDVVVGWDQKN